MNSNPDMPNNFQDNLYMGKIFQRVNGQWHPIESAVLTPKAFLNINILLINKMKIKAESHINGTRMIKISTATGDFFFSVMAQDQAEWMTRILWAKLAAMGR